MKTPQKDIKERILEEFDEKFIHKGEDGDQAPEEWAWTIKGSFPIEVKDFLKSALSSLESSTIAGIREKIEKSIQDEPVPESPERMKFYSLGYNDARADILEAIDNLIK